MYSGYDTRFDMKRTFWFSTGGFGKNVIIFGVDMSFSVHVYNKKKDILILVEGPTQALYEITMTAEKKNSINFTKYPKQICVSLHYIGANSYLFVNCTELHKCKAKDSEINVSPLCIGKISKDLSVDNMKKSGFYVDMIMILVLIMMRLQLIIYWAFTSVSRKRTM